MSVDPVATRRLIESLSTHLEDHLATWKSSLVDARRDIEKLLAAISDKIPAHATPLLPEELVSLMLEDVMPPPAVAAAPPPPQADWNVVRGSLTAIESARTQVDVLSRFLTHVNAHASRVALLVLRNDRLTGWKAIGFDASGGRDEAVRSVDLGGDDDPFVAAVLRAQRPMLAEPPDEATPLRRALGGKAPARTLLVPMVIRDRLAGILCADELPGEEGRLNEPAVEVLTFVTGLAVDLLAARKKIPSPSLTPAGEAITRFKRPGTPPAAAPVFEIGATSVAPPAPAPAPPPAHRTRSTDASVALRALEDSAKTRIAPAVRSFSSDPGLTSEIRSIGAVPVPPPPPSFSSFPPAPVAAPAPPPPLPSSVPDSAGPAISNASSGDFTGAFDAMRSGRAASPTGAAASKPARKPISAVMPPPDIAVKPRPISGFVPRGRALTAANPQRAHDDARRLARLLISEIKLYNEKKVEEGRAAGDLYKRLKDDIDRSRQVYDERTPAEVRQDTDFFHDELVRTLADGRAEALGSMS